MDKYEYKTVEERTWFIGKDFLNKLGKDGWELCSALPSGDRTQLILKRKVEEKPAGYGIKDEGELYHKGIAFFGGFNTLEDEIHKEFLKVREVGGPQNMLATLNETKFREIVMRIVEWVGSHHKTVLREEFMNKDFEEARNYVTEDKYNHNKNNGTEIDMIDMDDVFEMGVDYGRHGIKGQIGKKELEEKAMWVYPPKHGAFGRDLNKPRREGFIRAYLEIYELQDEERN